MHPIRSQLYADHYNFIRLLKFLQSELAYYEGDQGRHPRLSVILDIFDYIQAYPERWHHPTEDEVFELLLVKQVPNSDQIWSVKSEHRKLEQLTRKASELFTSIANDVVIPVDELLTAAHEFIARQLEHIDSENKAAYPLFEQYVSDDEWDNIGKKIQSKKDPLFIVAKFEVEPENSHNNSESNSDAKQDSAKLRKDRALKAEYKNLYKLIMQAERNDVSGATARALDCVSI